MGRAASKVYRVAVNILNKDPRTADKVWSSSGEFGGRQKFFLFKRHSMISKSLQGLRIKINDVLLCVQ
jgi:hypothetical protein